MSSVFSEFIARYGWAAGEEGPVLFVREVLGASPDLWQELVLRAYGRGERRVSIRSCHGPGKTALLAWLVLYNITCRYPQKTVATAPSRAQLEDALVSEVNAWFLRLPPLLQELFEQKKNRLELKAAPDSSFFSARTGRDENPEVLQGIHSENVLLIADEASGVSEKVFEAAVGSMSGHNATTILAGNPVRTSGLFFDTHNRLRSEWFTVHVSHKDSPRVSDEFVREVASTYGENSNAFRIRCLGEFPLTDQDTIIPFELIESARSRDIISPPNMTELWGLDVARYGDDSNVLIRRSTLAVLPKILSWSSMDLMYTVGKVKHEYDEANAAGRPPTEILVDVIGLGGGVVDRLRELNVPTRGINVSESASANERFHLVRTELWWKIREWLEGRDRSLPACDGTCRDRRTCIHERLAAELALLKYGFTSNGKIVAESKDSVKGRGYPSPDTADALALTFASEHATMMHGSKSKQWGRHSWSDPVHMGRSIV